MDLIPSAHKKHQQQYIKKQVNRQLRNKKILRIYNLKLRRPIIF
jgi:hypothetical protein